MSEVNITVVGNVATEPKLDRNRNGDAFAHFRLASNSARYDARSRSWVDDDTSFYTVYCWRSPLADNIAVSLHKGDPVVVYGRLKNREWRDDNQAMRISPEITARSLGHDLYRGTSTFTKVSRQPAIPEDDDAVESVRAAYFAADDQHGVVDRRTGEIEFGPRGGELRPGIEQLVRGGAPTNRPAGGDERILNGAPAAVGDRLTAGDRMAADDRMMGDDRTGVRGRAPDVGDALGGGGVPRSGGRAPDGGDALDGGGVPRSGGRAPDGGDGALGGGAVPRSGGRAQPAGTAASGRSARTATSAPGTEAAAAAGAMPQTDADQARSESSPPADPPPAPRSGGRARREKAGVGG